MKFTTSVTNKHTRVGEAALEKFGKRIRLRVCGVCWQGEGLLMINHKGLYPHDFWAPPGGGVELGESVEEALRREFKEECGVDIEIGAFLFGCEFIRSPLHAVELFFKVDVMGQPTLGFDPEMEKNQIILDLKFMTPSEVLSLPKHSLHGLFQKTENPMSILDLRGFFTFT